MHPLIPQSHSPPRETFPGFQKNRRSSQQISFQPTMTHADPAAEAQLRARLAQTHQLHSRGHTLSSGRMFHHDLAPAHNDPRKARYPFSGPQLSRPRSPEHTTSAAQARLPASAYWVAPSNSPIPGVPESVDQAQYIWKTEKFRSKALKRAVKIMIEKEEPPSEAAVAMGKVLMGDDLRRMAIVTHHLNASGFMKIDGTEER